MTPSEALPDPAPVLSIRGGALGFGDRALSERP